jgi:carboxyl-terminal processing protease
VTPEAPGKFMSHLISRGAFVGFARRFEAEGASGVTQMAGSGSRSQALSKKSQAITRDFKVDDRVIADFKAYLDSSKIVYTPEDVEQNRETIARTLLEEILRQSFGEGEARRRTLAWDAQVQKALALVPKADLLLRDPRTFIASREAEGRLASAGQKP